jgi:hypothetical protein
MDSIKYFSPEHFNKFTQKQFNKDLILGNWLVWKWDSFWSEFEFEPSGRFIQKKGDKISVGSWLYLPDLQIINISFWEKDIESLNFHLWYSVERDTIVFSAYQDNMYPKVFLVKKELFSGYYQQQAEAYLLNIFTEQYNKKVVVQTQTETNIIHHDIHVGCGIFGVLAVVSLILNDVAFLSWLVLIIVYIFQGGSKIKRKIKESRLNNNFIPTKGFNLTDIDSKVTTYHNKKIVYGIIGFFIILFFLLGYMA